MTNRNSITRKIGTYITVVSALVVATWASVGTGYLKEGERQQETPMVSVTPWTTTTPQDDSRVSCEHIERETGQDVCPVVSGDGLLRCRGEDSTPEFGEAACYLDGGFNRCGWKMLVMPDGTPWYLKWTDPRTKDEGGFCS